MPLKMNYFGWGLNVFNEYHFIQKLEYGGINFSIIHIKIKFNLTNEKLVKLSPKEMNGYVT